MRRSIACLTAVIIVLTGCGSPTATNRGNDTESTDSKASYEKVFAAVEGLSPAKREDKLIKLARKEGGSLRWYAAMQEALAQDLADAFSNKYDIDVKLYRADRTAVLQRVLEEASAGYQSGADVVEAPGVEMVQMSKKGLFVPYKSPVRDDLVKEARFDDWTAERLNVRVPTWNTNLLSKQGRPTSLRDLADPAYDGKMTVGNHDFDWFKTVWDYFREQKGFSQGEVEHLFQRIVSGSRVVDGNSARANLLSAGESSVSTSIYTHVSDSLIKDGAPISYEPMVEPAVLDPNGTALMGSAQHPATALLFIDWMMDEGQKIIAAAGTMPTRADMFAKSKVSDISRVLVDVEEFAAEQKKWISRWQKLLRLGKVVKE